MNYQLAEFETSFGLAEQLPTSSLPEIVFAGRSNVGKSSLMNRLFNRKNFARVSSQPGKTATVNFFKVGNVRFVDLPGYGFAKKSDAEKARWASLLDAYFSTGRNIRLVIQLIDMRHPPSEDDKTMMDFLVETGLPFLIVLTKCDKLNKTETLQRREELKNELAFLGNIETIEFSAVSGTGTDQLKKAIEAKL